MAKNTEVAVLEERLDEARAVIQQLEADKQKLADENLQLRSKTVQLSYISKKLGASLAIANRMLNTAIDPQLPTGLTNQEQAP